LFRGASLVILVALVAGGFEPMYVRIWTVDSATWHTAMEELPYRKLPGFRRLLLEVDRSTPRGARIAVVLPFRQWEGGYGYGYSRASFFLPGKQLVPLLEPESDAARPENLRFADYVMAWRARPNVAGFTEVWSTGEGTLLRRAPS
jgi:hypothetical protein